MMNNNTPLIKAIAVDYYGTLVDVGHPFDDIKQWLREYYSDLPINIDNIYIAFLKEQIKLQNGGKFYSGQDIMIKSYKKACDKYNTPFHGDEFCKLIYRLFTYPLSFPNVKQTITKLRKHYPVLLLTNADNNILYESIKLQGFDFDFVLSSEDLQCNKPNIKIFKRASELLNVSPEHVLMIGDSLSEDIYGAIGCGMQAIWINKENCQCDTSILQIASINEVESILQLSR